MRTIRWVAAIAALGSTAFAVALWIHGYEGTVRLIASLSGYDKVEKISAQITLGRWRLLSWSPIALALVLLCAARRPDIPLDWLVRLRDAWRWGTKFLMDTWAVMPNWERFAVCVLLLLATVMRLWLAIREPVQVDEAMTWLLFTSRGPLVSWSFYAAPNNHILHSLLTNLTAWLPLEPTLALRVPALMAALFAQALLHPVLRKITGPAAAFVGTVLCVGSFPFIYYGYLSRGYMLVLLAFIVAYAATLHFLRTADRRALVILASACVAGLFTMPSFLYPAALLFGACVLFSREWGVRWAVVRSGLYMAFITLLLYLPGIAMSGIAAFTSNQWVKPTGRLDVLHRWWPHFAATFEWMIGSPHAFLIVLLLMLASLFLVKDGNGPVARVNVLLLMGSMAIPFVHGVIPFERTWIYLLVPVTVTFTLLVHQAVRTGRYYTIPMLFIGAMVGTGQFMAFLRKIPSYEYMAYNARTMVAAVRTIEPKDIYCEFVVMGDHLVYALRTEGSPFQYTLSPEGKERDRYLGTPEFSLLLVRMDHPIAHPAYTEIYRDDIQLVYVRTDIVPELNDLSGRSVQQAPQ